jgi:spore coat protein A
LTEIIDVITESDRNRQDGESAAPGELTPYVAPLPVPPVLRPASGDVLRETEIALRPTWVRLHPQLPPTLMWGYDGRVPGGAAADLADQLVRTATRS